MFRLTWYATPSDVNREVNNGRGPVDFAISRGREDKTVVEFKLASNSHLERNLERQVEVYRRSHRAQHALTAILFFTLSQERKVANALKRLGLTGHAGIVLLDARRDNKPAGSKA